MRFRVEKQTTARGFSRWIRPRMNKYLMQCCDCGLVHELQFRVVLGPVIGGPQSHQKATVAFRARRADGYTKTQRKARGLKERT